MSPEMSERSPRVYFMALPHVTPLYGHMFGCNFFWHTTGSPGHQDKPMIKQWDLEHKTWGISNVGWSHTGRYQVKMGPFYDTLWWTNSLQLKMAKEIVDVPIKNGGSFHCYVSSPEGMHFFFRNMMLTVSMIFWILEFFRQSHMCTVKSESNSYEQSNWILHFLHFHPL